MCVVNDEHSSILNQNSFHKQYYAYVFFVDQFLLFQVRQTIYVLSIVNHAVGNLADVIKLLKH